MKSLTEIELTTLAESIGSRLRGGECFELIGDVGTGKTTFTKALARGMGVREDVQSPSFTISREYDGKNELRLAHYDFYRLNDPGVVSYELAESIADQNMVTIIEWAETVKNVLPDARVGITFTYEQNLEKRLVSIDYGTNNYLETIK